MSTVSDFVMNYFESKGTIPGNTPGEKLKCAYLDSGLLDSMQLVEMIVEFEKEFGIRFSSDHMQSPQFRTIGGLISLVEELRGESKHA
jgi:hypothetical protein